MQVAIAVREFRLESCSEVLVKEGLSLQFITLVFQIWLSEKNITHVSSALRKAQLETRLTVSYWNHITGYSEGTIFPGFPPSQSAVSPTL